MQGREDNYSLLIRKLDSFIKKYYTNKMLKGGLLFLSISLLAFIVFTLLESQFYFSTGVRKFLFYGYLISMVGLLTVWVVIPLLNYLRLGNVISHEQAASIIGNHFGDVQDKLLNVLQLKKQSNNFESAALINASIDQKSEEIKIVPFQSAIDLSKNRKYLKYALPPFMLLIILVFAAPSLITDPTHRIINNNRHFEKDAPFKFIIDKDQLEVLQYDDYPLSVSVEGEVRPQEVFIDVDGYQYRLKENKDGNFTYVFRNIQKATDFKLFSGNIQSEQYKLDVLKKPNLTDFSVTLDYPSYTGRKDETLNSVGDFVVPQGTVVKWNMNVENTEMVSFRFSDSQERVESKKTSPNSFAETKKLMRDVFYKIYVSNNFLPEGDSTSYSVNVIPDLSPTISVEKIQDTVEKNVIYFIGNASDDYGLRSLSFNYTIQKANGQTMPLVSTKLPDPKNTQVSYDYLLDINDLKLESGDNVSFYFEVFDNDGVNGSKSARTGIMTYSKASIEELKEMENINEEEIKKDLLESMKESRKLQEELKKLKEKLLQKNELDWQDRKELEEMLEKQKELQKKLEEAKKKFEENLKNQEEMQEQDPELQEKQEKLQELFEEAQNKEMEELMEQIQELLQELEKDNALEMMEEMEMNDERQEQNMERLLELFKQLEVEKEANELIQELEKLAEEQEKLSQETLSEEKSQEELQQEQQNIEEQFEKLEEKLEELEKKNEELEVPKDLGQDNEEKSEEIKEEMQNSEEKLGEKQNNDAAKSQKKAAEKMKSMASEMAGAMQAGEMEQMQEDIAALRQLLENLVDLSFDQEDLIENVSRTNSTTPKYVSLVQEQFKLKDDFSLIQDSLIALSKRVNQIETFVTDKVSEIKSNLNASLENLENRQKPLANDNQRRVMKNTNDLAVMLAESMENMQQQMSSMAGSGSCPNPGGQGQSKGGKGNQGSVPMDKITEGQQGLGEKMKEMMQGQKEGGKKGMSKEFAQAAARQAALRKALEEIKQGRDEQGKSSQGLEEMIQQMDKIETDLVNKRLNNEMLKRQQDIVTRLLEAEKADRQRELDEKRLAERTTEKQRKYPPQIEEYIKKKESEVEMYKTVSPSLKPYYKYLVEEYYKSLKENN
ncbi:DUF4175 family protein [Portibacter marinus]|uniref:DUF4175 family protein n=1 Tax=Portibacter marinus TaxID=2898660 RepID=UPI001F42849D|nr:DUF4175 family protein [Portibacter marinus]